MEKNILLSGCTGFIGQFLVPQLIKRRWRPIVLSRRPVTWVRELLSDQVEVINHFDEVSPDQHISACINLSGESIFDRSWTDERKSVLYNSRIEVTERFCSFVHKMEHLPEVFISGSAIGYYGSQPPDIKITENSGPGTDFASQLCIEWEAATHAIPATMRLCLLRTGIVLHPRHGMLNKLLPLFKYCLGGPQGSGQQILSWIHVEDMVDVIIYLLDNHRMVGPINAVAPNPVSNEVFSRTLARTLNRPCLLKTPSFIIQALFGERAPLILEGQQVVPEKLMVNGFTFKFPDLNSALADLLSSRV